MSRGALGRAVLSGDAGICLKQIQTRGRLKFRPSVPQRHHRASSQHGTVALCLLLFPPALHYLDWRKKHFLRERIWRCWFSRAPVLWQGVSLFALFLGSFTRAEWKRVFQPYCIWELENVLYFSTKDKQKLLWTEMSRILLQIGTDSFKLEP